MSILNPDAGWPDIDGINTNERLLGGANGPLNRAASQLTARTKQLSDWRDELVASVNQLTVRVKDLTLEEFGAVSGGVQDCRQAFLDADAAAAPGSRLVLSPGAVYRVSAAPTLRNIAHIEGNGAFIKMLAADLSAGAIALVMRNLLSTFDVSGAEPITVAANSDRVPRTSQLATVQVGDLLALKSNQVRTWLNSASSTPYYDGQYVVVNEVTPSELVVSTPFYASFPVNTVDHIRPPAGMSVRNLGFDLSQTQSTATTVIGLDIRGCNMVVENFRFVGNDFVAIGLQMQGENGVVINTDLTGALNGLGNGSARLGYGINFGGNSLRAFGGTFHNVKHAVTNAVRTVMSRALGVYGASIKQYRRDPSYDTALAAVDTHANTLDIFDVCNNVIDTEGHACTFRNGKLRFVGNTVLMRGSFNMELVRNTENPTTFLDVFDNDVTFSSDAHIGFDPAASQNPSNVTLRGNRFSGPGHVLRTRSSLVYDATNIRLLDNAVGGLRSIINVSVAAGSFIGLRESGTAGQMAAVCQYGMRLMSDSGATGKYVSTQLQPGYVTWAANSLSNLEGIHLQGTFEGGRIGPLRWRIQNGVNFTVRGLWIDQCNLSQVDIDGVDIDSEITVEAGTAVVTAHDGVRYTNNRAEALRMSEPTGGLGFTQQRVTIDRNTFNNTRNLAAISLTFPTSGSTSLSNSGDIAVTGNNLNTTAATCLAMIGGSGSANSKLAVLNNLMSGNYVESSGRYRIPPLGNVQPAPNPYKGGTTIRQDGTVSAATAPTAGGWVVGERVYNSTPAVGQPKSWVCTVAGSPGTWVSEGNL